MFFFSVQAEDTGEYICSAQNPVGSIETRATLRTNAPPRFTKIPENQRVKLGKSVIFECEAFGQPHPGIFWSKEGEEMVLFYYKNINLNKIIIYFSYLRILKDEWHLIIEFK